jgi:hypothetical protein
VCTTVTPSYRDLKDVSLFLTQPNSLDPSAALALYVKAGSSEWLYRGCVHNGHPSDVMPLQVGRGWGGTNCAAAWRPACHAADTAAAASRPPQWPTSEGGSLAQPAPGSVQIGVSIEPQAEVGRYCGTGAGGQARPPACLSYAPHGPPRQPPPPPHPGPAPTPHHHHPTTRCSARRAASWARGWSLASWLAWTCTASSRASPRGSTATSWSYPPTRWTGARGAGGTSPPLACPCHRAAWHGIGSSGAMGAPSPIRHTCQDQCQG